MKLINILVSLILVLPFTTNAKDKSYGDVKVLELTSIYNGDTFRGKCDKEKQLAREAKQFTVEHLRAAKNITLKNIKRGKYFRLIADVYVDGVSLADQLIKQGHAVEYKGKTKRSWCK